MHNRMTLATGRSVVNTTDTEEENYSLGEDGSR